MKYLHRYTCIHHITNIFLNQDGKIDLLTFFIFCKPIQQTALSLKEINVFCNVTLWYLNLILIVRGLNTKSSMTYNCKHADPNFMYIHYASLKLQRQCKKTYKENFSEICILYAFFFFFFFYRILIC